MNSKTILIILLFSALTAQSSVGQTFLETRVKNVNGQQSNILKESGESEIIVLDFWATWCKPCIKALPKIEALSEEFKENSVKFIGVNGDSPRNTAKVKPFVKTHGISYPVILDKDQEIMSELLINAFPTLVIINRKGEILYTHKGFSNGDEKIIRSKIKELISS